MDEMERLEKEYTYNGAVSMKALDDDIAVLSDKLDDFALRIRECAERGLDSGHIRALAAQDRGTLAKLRKLRRIVEDRPAREPAKDIAEASARAAEEVVEALRETEGKEGPAPAPDPEYVPDHEEAPDEGMYESGDVPDGYRSWWKWPATCEANDARASLEVDGIGVIDGASVTFDEPSRTMYISSDDFSVYVGMLEWYRGAEPRNIYLGVSQTRPDGEERRWSFAFTGCQVESTAGPEYVTGKAGFRLRGAGVAVKYEKMEMGR